jgi:hypothetical protein
MLFSNISLNFDLERYLDAVNRLLRYRAPWAEM